MTYPVITAWQTFFYVNGGRYSYILATV